MYEQIIVPVDTSELSARALVPAAVIARACDAEMQVVSFAMRDASIEQVRDSVEVQTVGIDVPSLSIEVDVVEDRVSDGIVDLVEMRPDSLVCMSSVGRGRTGAALGSVAEGVLRQLARPVLLVGPHTAVDRFALTAGITGKKLEQGKTRAKPA